MKVHDRAARRGGRQLLLVLDHDDPTASELYWKYAPLQSQLARAGADDVDVIAMRLDDGLRLLRAPKHAPTIFERVADEIEADASGNVIGVCIAHGGFVRFAVAEGREVQ
jgi:hypothetical protein